MTKEEIKKEIIEDCSYDSNYDYYILTEQDINILVDELHKKLNMHVVGVTVGKCYIYSGLLNDSNAVCRTCGCAEWEHRL